MQTQVAPDRISASPLNPEQQAKLKEARKNINYAFRTGLLISESPLATKSI